MQCREQLAVSREQSSAELSAASREQLAVQCREQLAASREQSSAVQWREQLGESSAEST